MWKHYVSVHLALADHIEIDGTADVWSHYSVHMKMSGKLE